jgi:hypothetical protein
MTEMRADLLSQQEAIMRDEVAVVTVLPGGKGHRGFDPSRVDNQLASDDKTGD